VAHAPSTHALRAAENVSERNAGNNGACDELNEDRREAAGEDGTEETGETEDETLVERVTSWCAWLFSGTSVMGAPDGEWIVSHARRAARPSKMPFARCVVRLCRFSAPNRVQCRLSDLE
jgi:hypothetical protein